jgi:hypothetical protein
MMVSFRVLAVLILGNLSLGDNETAQLDLREADSGNAQFAALKRQALFPAVVPAVVVVRLVVRSDFHFLPAARAQSSHDEDVCSDAESARA